MNKLKKILRYFSISNRWEQIRIENTNLCLNECVMCPREKLTRPKGIMSYEEFCYIIKKLNIKYKSMLHFHGFGEPLLDERLPDKIKYIKRNWPNFTTYFITCLAAADRNSCEKIVDSGIDIVSVSIYGNNADEYKKIFKKDNYQEVLDNINFLKEYIKKTGSKAQIVQSDPMLAHHNFSNGRYYNKPAVDKICPVIFGERKYILQITWDGYVIPCCFDYNAAIKFGNIFSEDINEIFKSRDYIEFERAQQKKDYSKYMMCGNCDKKDAR